MKGFHNSFDAYCDWCDKQVELELPTMCWGDWWDNVADKGTHQDPTEFKGTVKEFFDSSAKILEG